jgi:hypothetical protein
MKSLLLISILPFLLTSCYVFETNLSVENQLDAYAVVDGVTQPGHLNEITIAAGDYQGRFVAVSTTQLNFYSEIDGTKFHIPIFMPLSTFDRSTGMFKVSAKQAGQPWGYRGKLVRTYKDSSEIEAVEECGKILYREVCRNVPGPDGTYRQVCREEGYIVPGNQDVKFKIRSINEHFYAIPSDQEVDLSVRFEGDRDTEKKIYTYQGECI